MTVGRTDLLDAAIYVAEDSHETMPTPELGNFLSTVDASVNAVLVCDLDHKVLTELINDHRGLTHLDHKQRSEYPSVTTASAESYDEHETPPISPAIVDAAVSLSEIASAWRC